MPLLLMSGKTGNINLYRDRAVIPESAVGAIEKPGHRTARRRIIQDENLSGTDIHRIIIIWQCQLAAKGKVYEFVK